MLATAAPAGHCNPIEPLLEGPSCASP
jgi:hypothetical protein